MKTAEKIKATCYHCGEDCIEEDVVLADKHFCCDGCKLVYEILNQNDLCTYYNLEKNPGISQKIKVRPGKFSFLDDAGIKQKLIQFREGEQCCVTLYLPQMHCSSCIWVLENLTRINKNIVSSTVNFLKREIVIVYNEKGISLKQVAELLTSIGYEPHISLHDISSKQIKKYDRTRIYKIGIAGFCFGNIMMLSFPEYFSSGELQVKGLKNLFTYLNLVLSLPVFFYSASEFFISGYKGLKQKYLNIDAPIALAVLITFGRSVYEILSGTGAGYLDSMSGIVFFMLIGRFFQDKTQQSLSFERDYTSYFPIAVSVLKDGIEKQIPVSEIKIGDRIKIHSNEIIPADGIVFLGSPNIDYSFVTGESLPLKKTIGEIVYAGGKQVGGAIELEVVKDVSQSYLTQLWNKDVFKRGSEKKVSFIHKLSRYFTYALFSIAITSYVYWSFNDPSKAWSAVTAVLIVACPCALLLSATFTNGNLLRMLQKNKIYLKNSNVIESLAEADTIVFDKTGTLTQNGSAEIKFEGCELSDNEKQMIRSLASQSNHPLSKAIVSSLPLVKSLSVKQFSEVIGKGLEGEIDGNKIKIGSAVYVFGKEELSLHSSGKVYVLLNDEPLGYYYLKASYRNGLNELIKELKHDHSLIVLSGDNDAERSYLQEVYGHDAELIFNQRPEDKLAYVSHLQDKGHKVIMIGDGLNDAGALMQSDAGIAVTDDTNNFSPACDAILDGKSFTKLNAFINYCRSGKKIILGSFVISILYNIVGLSFAVQGTLSPVIAAILMPVSSISILLFTTGMSTLLARKLTKV